MTITDIIAKNKEIYGHDICPSEAAIIADLLAYDLTGKQPSDFPLLAHLVDDDRLDEADDLLGRARDLQGLGC